MKSRALIAICICGTAGLSLLAWYQYKKTTRENVASIADIQGPGSTAVEKGDTLSPSLAPSSGVHSNPGELPLETAKASPSTNAQGNDLLQDSRYREARIEELSLRLRESYPGLIEELGLNAEEADQLFRILAEAEIDGRNAPSLGQVASAEDLERYELRRSIAQTSRDQALRSLLGDERFSKWQSYLKVLPAYQRVDELSRSLSAAGVGALDQTQQRVMRDAFVAEVMQEQELRSASFAHFQRGTMDSSTILRYAEDSLRHQETQVDRLLSAASNNLTPQQLDRLRTLLERRLAVRREEIRVLRE